ncbi:hypothetical protein [Paenibacillus popilliae]|uniref:Uncharacterized conserved protein n=1 Tax=Paenibacillus popilliae ATCC 14706 TaxID=1212764 RepID=M9M5N3_PAEPP|nr:hypothetical protein [Paenibacillus popilliae]GAC42653.1 uncharacterized conserved protein [Paenibacillus popilliae ATCC 14706]
MKLKKGLVATGLSIALLTSAGSALAATKYGPSSPVVPRLGGNWYSNSHPASGSTQVVEMGSIGGEDKAIFGTICDSSKNNISPETALPEYNTTNIYSSASKGQTIMLMLETSLWNYVDTQCTFSWTP